MNEIKRIDVFERERIASLSLSERCWNVMDCRSRKRGCGPRRAGRQAGRLPPGAAKE